MNLMLLRALRRSGKKQLYVIPFLFTFANALCGFLAVITALDGDCCRASLYILLAGLMDLLDGRVARALGTTSSLGMELDSLCDAVSFCLAPTIVLYGWKFYDMGSAPKGVLALYLFAGLFRLAKFNACSGNQNSYFVGLPTPLAALICISLVLHDTAGVLLHVSTIHPYSIMMLCLLLAILMVCPVRFPAYKNVRLSHAKASLYAVLCISIALWSLAHDYPVLFVFVALYIGVNCCKYLQSCCRNYRLNRIPR